MFVYYSKKKTYLGMQSSVTTGQFDVVLVLMVVFEIMQQDSTFLVHPVSELM